MPIFEIQGPDGKIYEVDAPDENTAVSAFGQFTQQIDSDGVMNAGTVRPPQPPAGVFKSGPVDMTQPVQAAPAATEGPSNTQVGVQAVGKGMADLLGMGSDLKNLADQGVGYAGEKVANTAIGGVNKLFGSEIDPVDLSGFQSTLSPVDVMSRLAGTNLNFGSDDISGAFAENVAGPLGIDTFDTEDMTSGQRIGYEGTRFATGAAIPAAGLARNLSRAEDITKLPALLRPYATSPKRAVAADTAAGAGAGVAMAGYEDYAPEAVQDTLGPFGPLLATVIGGTAGNTAMNYATSPRRAAQATFDKYMSAGPALMDPATGITPRRDTANQAARVLQGNATDKDQAIADIVAGEQFIAEAGGQMPTTAMLTDDVGMRQMGKSAALQDGKPFAEVQEQVKRDATADVQAMRPETADTYAPRNFAEALTGRAQGMADNRVTRTTGAADEAMQAETAIGETLRPMAGQRDAASEALDKVLVDDTMRPMQTRKNELFRGIDPEGAEMRDLTPIADVARGIADEAAALPPSMRGDVVPEGLLADIEAMMPKIDPETLANVGGEGVMSFKAMNEMRPLLAEAQRRAQSEVKSPLAGSIGKMKRAIGDEAARVADEGGEAGARAQEANRYYAEEFAPLFSRGEGAKLRKDVNRDDLFRSNVKPTATASRFLTAGEGGKEKAADLRRILSSSPSKAKGEKAARDFIMADLAKNGGIGPDGRIVERQLQSWMNERQGMLSQMPDIKKEIDTLLDDVRGKAQASSALKAEVQAAAKNAKLTEQQIQKSALSLLIDRDPDKAVAAVLSSKDPLGAAKELSGRLRGNKAAQEGWKAAVSDHMLKKLTDASGEVTNAKISQFMKQNDKVLREVFGDDLKYLNRAQQRMKYLASRDVQATPNSATAENMGIAKKFAMNLAKPYEIVARMLFGALTGGSMVRKYKLMAEQLPDSSDAAQALFLRAQLDPKVAKHLLQRPLHEVGTTSWNKQLNRLMGWAAAGREVSEEEE